MVDNTADSGNDTSVQGLAAPKNTQTDRIEAADGKVPMPANGKGGPIVHSDGVSDVESHGRTGGGESGGGGYPNPHTGKEARGESGGFEGGQSMKGYYGGGQLDGKEAPDEDGAPVDKGSGGSG
jgi:hypothetical protein